MSNRNRRDFRHSKGGQVIQPGFQFGTTHQAGTLFEPAVSTVLAPGVARQIITGGATRVEVAATQIACALIAADACPLVTIPETAAEMAKAVIEAAIDVITEENDEPGPGETEEKPTDGN